MELEQIPDVGPRKAERLNHAGYDLAEDVAYANLAIITEVDGINHETVRKAQEKLGIEERVLDIRTRKLYCQYRGKGCEHKLQGDNVATLKAHESNCAYNPSTRRTPSNLKNPF